MTIPERIVVMGVAGCGKSTLGLALAEQRGLAFVEGDDLHPEENRAAMRAGQPLDDAMRRPWLDRIAQRLKAAPKPGLVVTCSALRRSYRDRLRCAGEITFLHLTLDLDEARRRIEGRVAHYMPSGLAESQFATLEPTFDEGDCIALDAKLSLDSLLETSESHLSHTFA